MPTLDRLAGWLSERLGEAAVFRPGPPEVHRLALALEPTDLPTAPEADALFLHRAFRLGERAPGLGVLASHDGFDRTLTTGVNRALAETLGWQEVRALTLHRAEGLLATPPQPGWASLLAALEAEFGGYEALLEPATPSVPTLALMNAMRPEVLDAVAERGVRVYLTGQMRPGALPRARELGLGVIALGHRRTEQWGLRQLARELEAAFSDLSCAVYAGAGREPRGRS